MNIYVVAPIVAMMIALRFIRLNILAWMAVWWIAIYITLSYGIDPPLPSSIIVMFMAIVTLALLAYLTASSDYMEVARRNIVRFLVEKKFALPLTIIAILIPSLVATKVYLDATEPPQPPLLGRTIHPPPPISTNFKGGKIDLVTAENPFRELEESNSDSFAIHVNNGRKIYYQNCVFCHGDNLEGQGNFAHGFDPIPANFNDPTTIAQLQESYLFWRIAKGAPGLPPEATPWSSAMPAWENFLTEEEIWDVILFLYEFTNQKPRAREEIEH